MFRNVLTIGLDVFKLMFMNFSTWIDAGKGRSAAIAQHFGRTPGAISQWRLGVPARLMRQVRDFTGGEVTLDEMLEERELSTTQKEATH